MPQKVAVNSLVKFTDENLELSRRKSTVISYKELLETDGREDYEMVKDEALEK